MYAVLKTGVAHLFEFLLPFDSAKPGRLLADAPIQRAVDRSLPASDSFNVRVGPTRLQPLHSRRRRTAAPLSASRESITLSLSFLQKGQIMAWSSRLVLAGSAR